MNDATERSAFPPSAAGGSMYQSICVAPFCSSQSRAQPGAVFHPITWSGYPVIIHAGSGYRFWLVQCFFICLKNSLMRRNINRQTATRRHVKFSNAKRKLYTQEKD